MSAPPLILLHGWGMNGGVWEQVVSSLAGHGEVMTPDLPGHGAEPAVPGGLDGLVGWLRERAPEDGVWVGWSLGATVMLAAAARAGGPRPLALVLVSATPRFTAADDWPHGVREDRLAAFGEALASDYDATLRRFLLLQSGDPASARAPARRLAAACAARGAPDREALSAGLQVLADTDLRDVVPRLMLPLTVVHGARDVVVPPAAGRWLAGQAPASRMIELAEAGHAPFLDAPQAFVSLLEETALAA